MTSTVYSGSGSEITITPRPLSCCLRSTRRRPSARPTTAFLAAMMQISKATLSCYWPGIYQDVEQHVKTCLTCQQRKWLPNKPTPLSPLPVPERPNWRIHADLFGPMLTANSNKKFVLCITDAFTKYAVVMAIPNKNAETVADAIFKEWFPNSEFRPRFTLMEILNVVHTKTSPAHPQCNSQVKVFNKMVKKYLALFVDDTALNW